MKTKICELFNIEYPIILGGMLYISRAELVAAVSENGGLGILAAGSLSGIEEIIKEIKKTKELTTKPFGINIPIFKPNSAEIIKTALEEGIKIFSTSAGSPKKYTKELKEKGAKVFHVIASVEHARKAEDAGVDAIVAEGIEAGGHDSPEGITTMALVPQVVDAVKIPVIAAGGIADKRTFNAAIDLGASAVQLGTRFMVSKESPLNEKVKNFLLTVKDNGTILLGARSFGHPVRVIKTKVTEKIANEEPNLSESSIIKLNDIEYNKRVYYNGEIESGVIMCGEIIGFIEKILSVKDIFDEFILHNKH